jgi:site-specific DNA recombinase
MGKQPKLHILTRVSTRPQTKKYGLKIQREQGLKYGKENGFDCEVYEEKGISGTLPVEQRPKLSILLKGVVKGEVKHIWVKDLSRLSRDNMVSFYLQNQFKKYGCILHSQSGDIDFQTPMESMFYGFQSLFNSTENEVRRQKSMEGKVKHFKSGGWRGGSFVFGYKSVRHKSSGMKMLVPNTDESKWVRQIFEWYDLDKSTKWIGQQLDKNGIKPRRSKFWNIGSIQSLLRNKIYIGIDTMTDKITDPQKPKVLTYKTERLRIVDDELFNRVRKKVQSNTQRLNVKGKTKYDVLLRGKIFCGDCGLMWSVKKMERPRYENFYRCPNKERLWRDKGQSNIKPCSNNKSMNIDRTNDIVWNTLCEVLNKSHLIKQEIKDKTLSKKLETEKDVKRQITKLKREQRKIDVRIDDIDERFEEVLTSYGKLEITKKVKDEVSKNITDEKKRLFDKRQDIDFEISKVNNKKGWLDWIKKHKGWIKDLSQVKSYKKRLSVVNQYVDRIVVNYDKEQNRHDLVIELILPIHNDKLLKRKNGYVIGEGSTQVETQYSKKKIEN